MSSFYADDFTREFNVSLLLGDANAPHIWVAPLWQNFIEAVEPLVSAARGAASVEGSYCDGRSGKYPRLKRFKSRLWRNVPPSVDMFANWWLFAPSDAVCAQERRTPDVFVSIVNERGVTMSDLPYGAVITLAVGVDVAGAETLVAAASELIIERASVLMTAKWRRAWGFETASGYNNGISETSWFKAGTPDHGLGSSILSDTWDEVVVRTSR